MHDINDIVAVWADPILRGGVLDIFCNGAPLLKIQDFEAILAEQVHLCRHLTGTQFVLV